MLDAFVGADRSTLPWRPETPFSRFSPLDAGVTIAIGAHLSGALPAHPSVHVQPLSRLLKGRPKPLVADGDTQPDILRKEAITVRDLGAAMRLKGLARLEDVRTATLKRKGALSLHPDSRRPTGACPLGARPVQAV